MPRFYLHLVERGEILLDQEGAEYSDVGSARVCAIVAARQIMAHDITGGTLSLNGYIQIDGEGGDLLERVHFSDVVAITPLFADKR